MDERDEFEAPEAPPPRFTTDGRHVIAGHNDGRFRAPTTRALGIVLIIVGILLVFSADRWASPYCIVGGIVMLVFARYVRHFMTPDSWFIAEDDAEK
jgi:uncharacterized membrane protein YkgB